MRGRQLTRGRCGEPLRPQSVSRKREKLPNSANRSAVPERLSYVRPSDGLVLNAINQKQRKLNMIATASPALRTPPGSSSLADVLDLILDKGIVIDAYVRVSLVGIELLTVDARVVIASVDTYLRWAEAVHRLVLESRPRDVPDMVSGATSLKGKAKKALGLDDESKE